MIKKMLTAFKVFKNEGFSKIVQIIRYRVISKKIDNFNSIKASLKNKSGLEIGGTSWVFMDYNLIPIYKIIKGLDNCNFSSKTIWEGEIKTHQPFVFYKKKTGKQYISEATNLSEIKSETYDFIISSHCLEHVANPLKAIEEWLRVLKTGGNILVVLPNKDLTFDNKRPITTFEHLLFDYERNTSENDLTHLDEVLKLHDLTMDVKAGTIEDFKERCLNNCEIRAIHHHVFSIELLNQILEFFKVQIEFSEVHEDLVIFGKKRR